MIAKRAPAKSGAAARAAPEARKPQPEGVDAVLDTHPLKQEIEAVRLIIRGVSPAISEGAKWNAPSFRTEKDWFATVNLRAKQGVQVIFHLGARTRPDLQAFRIADPSGLMTWLGKDRAMVTLGSGRDIPKNRKALEAIVRAWIKQL